MNIKCPTCRNFHALFWTEDKGGKRDLGYRCNKVEYMTENRSSGYKEFRTGTKTRSLPEAEYPAGVLDASIPVELTKARKDEIQGKQQGQLILMYKK